MICIHSHVSVDQIRQPCWQPHPLEKEPRLLSPGSRRRYLQRWKRWVLKKLSLRESAAGEPTCHQTGLFACFQVSANTDSSMSGYLQMSKSDKKQGKRLWFVIKDKVLYTYAASEVRPDEYQLRRDWTKGTFQNVWCVYFTVFPQDVAALKSQPLLGFELKVDSPQSLQFKLYHKKTLYFIFKADDVQTAQRYGTNSAPLNCCIAWHNCIIFLLISTAFFFFFNRWIDSFREAFNISWLCV